MGLGEKYRNLAKIKGVGRVSGITTDLCLALMKRSDRHITSLEELAKLRLTERDFKPDSQRIMFSNVGSLVNEGVVYIPGFDGVLITSPSLIVQNYSPQFERTVYPTIRSGSELYVPQELTEELVKNAIPGIDSFVIENLDPIKTKDFDKDERAKKLFGDVAEDYGSLLHSKGNDQMPLRFLDKSFVNAQPSPFTYQLKLSAIDKYGQSAIDGSFPMREISQLFGVVEDTSINENRWYTGRNNGCYNEAEDEEDKEDKRINTEEKPEVDIDKTIRKLINNSWDKSERGVFTLSLPDSLRLPPGQEYEFRVHEIDVFATTFRSKKGVIGLNVVTDIRKAAERIRMERYACV